MNDQSGQQCVSYCTHCFVWSRGALTVKWCGSKTGGVLWDVKYHCLQSKRQFARGGQISHSIFSPLQMPPGAHAPLPAATDHYLYLPAFCRSRRHHWKELTDLHFLNFYPNVTTLRSAFRLSVDCNVGAPYSRG